MSEADRLAVLNQFNRAWNNHDLEAALALVTDDCVFDDTTRLMRAL